MLGRPVTSAGHRNATPLGVAFRASAHLLGLQPDKIRMFRSCIRTKLNLPVFTLGCSIRLAYQAADASHPNRAERARRRARKFRRIVDSFINRGAAETPIGRALPEESTGHTESMHRAAGNSHQVSVQRQARQKQANSSKDCGRFARSQFLFAERDCMLPKIFNGTRLHSAVRTRAGGMQREFSSKHQSR
jgi:hypothetical protein